VISSLAEKIYARSVHLKKYDIKSMLSKRNRLSLKTELHEIQEINETLLRELYCNTEYSLAHFDLALFMNKILVECIFSLESRKKNYRQTVISYIWGFHNLPRAFLSADDPMRVTPSQAIEYCRPYLKMD